MPPWESLVFITVRGNRLGQHAVFPRLTVLPVLLQVLSRHAVRQAGGGESAAHGLHFHAMLTQLRRQPPQDGTALMLRQEFLREVGGVMWCDTWGRQISQISATYGNWHLHAAHTLRPLTLSRPFSSISSRTAVAAETMPA